MKKTKYILLFTALFASSLFAQEADDGFVVPLNEDLKNAISDSNAGNANAAADSAPTAAGPFKDLKMGVWIETQGVSESLIRNVSDHTKKGYEFDNAHWKTEANWWFWGKVSENVFLSSEISVLNFDKTLYHGKSRGRNCFVIYDEATHKDLDMKKLVKQGVYTNMNSLMVQLGLETGFENKLRSAMSLVQEQFHIADMYYVGRTGRMHSVIDSNINEDVRDIDGVIDDEILKVSNLEEISDTSPKLYKALRKHNIGSALIIRIGLNMQTDGYLVCADQRSSRLWQEDECGILYFIAKSLAAHIRLNKDSMPE